MDYRQAWREILYASGPAFDLAVDGCDHDLVPGEPNLSLEKTFIRLCRQAKVTSWHGVEPVLQQMRTVPALAGLGMPEAQMDKILDRASGTEKPGIAHHTSIQRGTYQSTWGTPIEIINLVRVLYGDIYLDLCTNEEHNKTVGAQTYYTATDPCPKVPLCPPDKVVYCNPPGPAWCVREFWLAWLNCVSRCGSGAVGAFLIFNLDHWRQIGAPPRQMPVVVLRKRLAFMGARDTASFPSALVLSDLSSDQMELVEEHGHITRWG
jgi:hypothetical protein